MGLVLDKDGDATSSNCVPNYSQPSRWTFRCDKPIVSGDMRAPMISTTGVRD